MSILSDIGAFFLGISKDLLVFVQAFISLLSQSGGSALASIALQEVKAAEDAAVAAIAAGNTVTGAQKFAQAQAAIVAQLTAQGLPVVTNAVNGAIEVAVAQFRAQQAAAATPTPQA